MARLREIKEDNDEPPPYTQTAGSTESIIHSSESAHSEPAKRSSEQERNDVNHSQTVTQDLAKLDHDAISAKTDHNALEEHHDDTSGGKHHHHIGRRLKDKITGTTHEQREEERARREALYRKAYEAAPNYYYYGAGPGAGLGCGYGYGYGGGAAYNSYLLNAALLGGFAGFGLGGLWF